MITVVDNYDSFTYNLVQQIERLAGERLRVIRNDAFDPVELIASRPRAIVISPGPGTPSRAGRCIELIRRNDTIPLLGVCLGHQAIAEAFGARVVRGELPVHGKVSEVRHGGQRLFQGCPAPMHTARYHSLVVDEATLPDFLSVDARTEEGTIMAVSHRERPIFGIQFHPESFGTQEGDRLIVNFLRVCERDTTTHPPSAPSPLTRGEGHSGEVSVEPLLPSTREEEPAPSERSESRGARRADEGCDMRSESRARDASTAPVTTEGGSR